MPRDDDEDLYLTIVHSGDMPILIGGHGDPDLPLQSVQAVVRF